MRCLLAVGWFSSTKSSPAAAVTFLNCILAAGFCERRVRPETITRTSTVRWRMAKKLPLPGLLGPRDARSAPIILDRLFVLQYICLILMQRHYASNACKG